jgi:hypothetical protein
MFALILTLKIQRTLGFNPNENAPDFEKYLISGSGRVFSFKHFR